VENNQDYFDKYFPSPAGSNNPATDDGSTDGGLSQGADGETSAYLAKYFPDPGGTPPAPEPVPEPGLLDPVANIGEGIAERTASILGNMVGFAETAGENVENAAGVLDWVPQLGGVTYDEQGLQYLNPTEWEEFNSGGGEKILRNLQESLTNSDFGYDPGTTWEDFKSADGLLDSTIQLSAFGLENGLISIADMAGSLVNLPAYMVSRGEEIAQERAKNQGHASPTPEDLAIGTAVAAFVSASEKFGAEKVLAAFVKGGGAVKKILKAAFTEAGTEAIQEPFEYVGETYGTPVEQGMTREEYRAASAERSLQGAAGGFFGGGVISSPSALMSGKDDPVDDPISPTVQPLSENQNTITDALAASAGNIAASNRAQMNADELAQLDAQQEEARTNQTARMEQEVAEIDAQEQVYKTPAHARLAQLKLENQFGSTKLRAVKNRAGEWVLQKPVTSGASELLKVTGLDSGFEPVTVSLPERLTGREPLNPERRGEQPVERTDLEPTTNRDDLLKPTEPKPVESIDSVESKIPERLVGRPPLRNAHNNTGIEVEELVPEDISNEGLPQIGVSDVVADEEIDIDDIASEEIDIQGKRIYIPKDERVPRETPAADPLDAKKAAEKTAKEQKYKSGLAVKVAVRKLEKDHGSTDLVPVRNDRKGEWELTSKSMADVIRMQNESDAKNPKPPTPPEDDGGSPVEPSDKPNTDSGGNGSDFDISNVKRPNGAIGTQGVTEESVRDLLKNVAGMDVNDGMTMKEMVESFKANPEAQQKLRDFTAKNPVQIDTLPDGTYHLEDGHHRTFLLDQAGDTTVSANLDGAAAPSPTDKPGPSDDQVAASKELEKVTAELDKMPKNFDINDDPDVVGRAQELIKKKRDLTDVVEGGLSAEDAKTERARLIAELWEKGKTGNRSQTLSQLQKKLDEASTPDADAPGKPFDRSAYRRKLDSMSNTVLKKFAKDARLKQAGTTEELKERITTAREAIEVIGGKYKTEDEIMDAAASGEISKSDLQRFAFSMSGAKKPPSDVATETNARKIIGYLNSVMGKDGPTRVTKEEGARRENEKIAASEKAHAEKYPKKSPVLHRPVSEINELESYAKQDFSNINPGLYDAAVNFINEQLKDLAALGYRYDDINHESVSMLPDYLNQLKSNITAAGSGLMALDSKLKTFNKGDKRANIGNIFDQFIHYAKSINFAEEWTEIKAHIQAEYPKLAKALQAQSDAKQPLTPEEDQEARAKADQKEAKSVAQKKRVDEANKPDENDDLVTFLRKLGGLNMDTQSDIPADSLGGLDESNSTIGLKKLRQYKDAGLDIDEATEAAWEAGYIKENDKRLLADELFNSKIDPVYTPAGYETKARIEEQAAYEEQLAESIENWTDYVGSSEMSNQVNPETTRLMVLASDIDADRVIDITSREAPEAFIHSQLQEMIDEKDAENEAASQSESEVSPIDEGQSEGTTDSEGQTDFVGKTDDEVSQQAIQAEKEKKDKTPIDRPSESQSGDDLFSNGGQLEPDLFSQPESESQSTASVIIIPDETKVVRQINSSKEALNDLRELGKTTIGKWEIEVNENGGGSAIYMSNPDIEEDLSYGWSELYFGVASDSNFSGHYPELYKAAAEYKFGEMANKFDEMAKLFSKDNLTEAELSRRNDIAAVQSQMASDLLSSGLAGKSIGFKTKKVDDITFDIYLRGVKMLENTSMTFNTREYISDALISAYPLQEETVNENETTQAEDGSKSAQGKSEETIEETISNDNDSDQYRGIEDYPWAKLAEQKGVEILIGKPTDYEGERAYVIDEYSDRERTQFVRQIYAANFSRHRDVESYYANEHGGKGYVNVSKMASEESDLSLVDYIHDGFGHDSPYAGITPITDIKEERLEARANQLSDTEWRETVGHRDGMFMEPGKDDVKKFWGEEFKKGDTPRNYISKEESKTIVDGWKAEAKSHNTYEMGSGNSTKIVLSLFDDSGQWVQPWVDAGYDVRVIDLKRDDVDIRDMDRGWFESNGLDDVYVVLAACPCTYFTGTSARDRKPTELGGSPRPINEGGTDYIGKTHDAVDLVNHTLDIIDFLIPRFWALENPVGRIKDITGVPEPRLSFNPNNFGDDYTKKTQIYGNFNADLPTANVDPRIKNGGRGSLMQNSLGSSDEAKSGARSVTPEGFAYAFYMANNDASNPVYKEIIEENIAHLPESAKSHPFTDQARAAMTLGIFENHDPGYMTGNSDPYYIDEKLEESAPDFIQQAIKNGKEEANEDWRLMDLSMPMDELRAIEAKLINDLGLNEDQSSTETVDSILDQTRENSGDAKPLNKVNLSATDGDRTIPVTADQLVEAIDDRLKAINKLRGCV